MFIGWYGKLVRGENATMAGNGGDGGAGGYGGKAGETLLFGLEYSPQFEIYNTTGNIDFIMR